MGEIKVCNKYHQKTSRMYEQKTCVSYSKGKLKERPDAPKQSPSSIMVNVYGIGCSSSFLKGSLAIYSGNSTWGKGTIHTIEGC